MGLIFEDHMHDEFGSWPLGYVPFGAADFGEIQAVGRAVGSGDDAAFYDAWTSAGDRFWRDATSAKQKGQRSSARESYLRAACFYSASYRPLFGKPVDPRLTAAFRKQIAAFNDALALSDPPVQPLRIPFADTTLPAYLIPAAGHAQEVRPLLILTNGYDATVTDLYFTAAVAASRRGYHCLMFDGPGQGEMLIEHDVPLRPDWETVLTAVVDFALAQPIIDPARVALYGWSLGGYLALRAASGEHRLGACIADPGLWSVSSGMRVMALKMGIPVPATASLGDLDQEILDRIMQAASGIRKLRWTIIQRGFWVHGVDDLRAYLRSIETFTLDGRARQVRCPTLITYAEDDPLSFGAQAVFEALETEKMLAGFTAAEGASGHCEMTNRSLLNRRVLDWLDLAMSPEKR